MNSTMMAISIVQPSWLSDILQSYNQDKEAHDIIVGITAQQKALKEYQYNQGLIKLQNKIYVESTGDTRQKILCELHDGPSGGHSGHDVTYRRVVQFFHWPTVRQDVIKYVQMCDLCLRIKTGNQFPQGLLQPLPIPEQVCEDISLDFVEGLTKSNDKNCIMVVVDRLSKVGHFIALSHHFNATKVAQLFLDNIFKLHGMPKSMVSDRDKLFTSSFWKELFNLMGTQLHMSTSYHPQTNGQTERLNRCLEQYLRAMVSQRPKHWVNWLPLAEWWYNSSYNNAILRSPYEALYGIKPCQICVPASHRSSIDTVEDFQVKREVMNHLLKEAITTAQNKYTHYANKKRTKTTFEVGDWVYLKLQPYMQLSIAIRRHMKLAHKFFGPYEIIEKVGRVAYKLALPAGSQVHPVFHVSLLKKKVGTKYTVTTALPRLGDEGQFVVYHAKLLQRRMIKRGNTAVIQWLIQWSHSIPEDASWEDAEQIQEQYPDFNP